MPCCREKDHLASLDEIFRAVGRVPDGNRLKTFLSAAGVTWHGTSSEGGQDLVRQASTRIVSLGGVPLVGSGDQLALACSPKRPFDVFAYRQATEAMMGHAGMMSYLNPAGRSATEMFEMLRDRDEMSVAHTVSVGVLVSGVSVAAENEFNSQRDLAHLSRITSARTSLQNDPPLVVHDPKDIPLFMKALELARTLRGEARPEGRDELEAINLIYPAAKATAFIMTASLRNFTKLLQQETDPGKEREYRDALKSIRSNLQFIWPTLFQDLTCASLS